MSTKFSEIVKMMSELDKDLRSYLVKIDYKNDVVIAQKDNLFIEYKYGSYLEVRLRYDDHDLYITPDYYRLDFDNPYLDALFFKYLLNSYDGSATKIKSLIYKHMRGLWIMLDEAIYKVFNDYMDVNSKINEKIDTLNLNIRKYIDLFKRELKGRLRSVEVFVSPYNVTMGIRTDFSEEFVEVSFLKNYTEYTVMCENKFLKDLFAKILDKQGLKRV